MRGVGSGAVEGPRLLGEDLLRFDVALRTHRLLSPGYTGLVLEGKVDTPYPGQRYGYGFQDDRASGTRVVGHSGGFPGISAALHMYLDLGYTVAILSNYDGAARPVRMRAREILARSATGY